MPTLPSSGPLSINDIKNVMGGPASPSMANYYRGGAYVPSQKTVTSSTREPSSGEFYQLSGSQYLWVSRTFSATRANAVWANVNQGASGDPNATTLTVGNTTYYRGSFRGIVYNDGYGNIEYGYGVYRITTTNTTVNINTNVPTSGQISISQFYGAEKP